MRILIDCFCDRVKFLSVIIIGYMVVLMGCASKISVSDNEACVVKYNIPISLSNCMGAYDVVYKYSNPSRPKNVLFHTLYNPNVPKHYCHQEGKNHCYAAALKLSFSLLGLEYSQVQFSQAISQECFGLKDLPLTFSQIIFSATRVHVPPGAWYIDSPDGMISRSMNSIADKIKQSPIQYAGLPAQSRVTIPVAEHIVTCQGSEGGRSQVWVQAYWDAEGWSCRKLLNQQATIPTEPQLIPPIDAQYFNQLDLYKPVTWRFKDQPLGTVNGEILPIRNSKHLIDVFNDGVPVIAGLVENSHGHVVVISKIRFAVVRSGDHSVEKHPSGYIDWVEVADSADSNSAWHIIPGNEFLSSAHFLFAIYQDRRK
ncbi:hypothetical protein [Desulfobacter postgatei]|uniref:hypothetical protein n=1 Tax=Desulfobacter postgatei TaxID=2293 RepID=UPI00259BE73A|nr:hypothetical protein [uncultured Desulfobacter sp.]